MFARQLIDSTHRLAEMLKSKGVGRGDVVGLILPIGWQCLVSYIAANMAGACMTGLRVEMTKSEAIVFSKRSK